MTIIPNYWPDDYLSDGTPLPAGYANFDVIIWTWTGNQCKPCGGHGCAKCGRTGDEFAPVLRDET